MEEQHPGMAPFESLRQPVSERVSHEFIRKTKFFHLHWQAVSSVLPADGCCWRFKRTLKSALGLQEAHTRPMASDATITQFFTNLAFFEKSQHGLPKEIRGKIFTHPETQWTHKSKCGWEFILGTKCPWRHVIIFLQYYKIKQAPKLFCNRSDISHTQWCKNMLAQRNFFFRT